MIHCKNKDIKCEDNPYPWCDSFQCPFYEYTKMWKEEEPKDGREESRKLAE